MTLIRAVSVTLDFFSPFSLVITAVSRWVSEIRAPPYQPLYVSILCLLSYACTRKKNAVNSANKTPLRRRAHRDGESIPESRSEFNIQLYRGKYGDPRRIRVTQTGDRLFFSKRGFTLASFPTPRFTPPHRPFVRQTRAHAQPALSFSRNSYPNVYSFITPTG